MCAREILGLLATWDRAWSATQLARAGCSRPKASGLTLQSVRNSRSVRKIINVYAGPNTLTL
jgi:hypothetical protein